MSVATRTYFLCCFALALLLNSGVCAQTSPAAKATKPAAQAEVFDIPAAFDDFEHLMKFIEKIDNLQPTDSSEQAEKRHRRKVIRTIVAAAEQMLSSKPSDEDAVQCVYFQLQGLRFLARLGEPKADQLLSKAIETAKADKRADVQAVGVKFMVESGFMAWTNWNEKEKSKYVKEIVDYLTMRPTDANHIDMIMSVVDFLGDRNGEQYACDLMDQTLPHFKKSQQPEIQNALVMLEGINRRMGLPGNKIKLDGSMLDGSKLDWNSYRGKVVLVDFWATWCQPCRAEVPNVLKAYQDYHDKGFEVLGISLDERREQAEAYIKQEKIPWATMFSEQAGEQGWQHPMAVRYGITGIPRAILVDQEGKVVHMLARGPNLDRELRRLLGEPVARSAEPKSALTEQATIK